MDCYRIPMGPAPLLLPVECVADVVATAQVTALEESRANWMLGHTTWKNQRIPVMSYSDLHGFSAGESGAERGLVVLNPVPDAVRKAYSAIVFDGDVDIVVVDESAEFVELPEGVDRRYAEAAVSFDESVFLVPKLSALAVAFSYF